MKPEHFGMCATCRHFDEDYDPAVDGVVDAWCPVQEQQVRMDDTCPDFERRTDEHGG